MGDIRLLGKEISGRRARGGASVARIGAVAFLIIACLLAPAVHAELWVTSLYRSVNPAQILRYETTTGALLGKLEARINNRDVDLFAAALGPDGFVYVSYGNGGIARFDASGHLLGVFAPEFPSVSESSVYSPLYLAFGPGGDLFVVINRWGTRSAKVFRYDGATGAFKGIALQEGDGGLNGISGIAFGPDGTSM